MSVIKFKLTEQHISLAKNIRWDNLLTEEVADGDGPFGHVDDLYDDMGLILFGMPEGDFDPTSSKNFEYSDQQKAEMDELMEDMPKVLQIITSLGTIELGNYKTKFNQIAWKKKK